MAKKIIRIAKTDQKVRKDWADSGFDNEKRKLILILDKKSTALIRSIVNEIGWPTISKVGEEASTSAWLLVQHSDDKVFQKEMLLLMKKETKKDIEQKYIAKLEDRILRSEGKKQLYGTSFVIDIKTKKLTVDPIQDIKNIDKRRKKMGLDSFAKHKKRAFESYEEHKRKCKK